jgi:hypothetical protein
MKRVSQGADRGLHGRNPLPKTTVKDLAWEVMQKDKQHQTMGGSI